MQFFNLLNVDPSDVLRIKNKYEQALKSSNKLDQSTKLSLDDMVRQLNLTETILVDSEGKIIPFSIQTISPEFSYVFFTSNDNGDSLKTSLESIEYDLSRLKQLSNDEVMQRELLQSGTPYFVRDSSVYIV